MKITINLPKPRSPFLVSARLRRAGTHARPQGAQRQRARRELQRELEHSSHSP